jgi:hypothetical protein
MRPVPITSWILAAALLALVLVSATGCCGPNEKWDFWKARCIPILGKSSVNVGQVVQQANATISRETSAAVAVVDRMKAAAEPAAEDAAALAQDYPADLRVQRLNLYFTRTFPDELVGLTLALTGIQIANETLAPVPAAAKQNEDAAAAAIAGARKEAKQEAEKSALLWMMMIGGGFIAAGVGLGIALKDLTLGIVLGAIGGTLIAVSRVLSAVDNLLTDHPILCGLVAVLLLLVGIGIVGWRCKWWQKITTQTVAGVQAFRNTDAATPAVDTTLTTELKAKQDTSVQVAAKALADKAQAAIDALVPMNPPVTGK